MKKENEYILTQPIFERIYDLKLYPNPTSGLITIQSNETMDEIVIYNMFGQEMQKIDQAGTQTQVSLENLPLGVYIVKATWGTNQKTVRIIKE